MNTMTRTQYLLSLIKRHYLLWSLGIVGLCIAYYTLMLLALIVKFQALPNYINVFDWIENVLWIIESTPSVSDAMLIISEEWWLEIGFMNYDFGMGISEWSMFVSPWKILSVAAFSALLLSYLLVLKYQAKMCRPSVSLASKLSTGVGGLCFALTSLTMSWVVCCATPTWIVGLAIMGLGVSTSLAIEPIGIWLNVSGFMLMVLALYLVLNKEMVVQKSPAILVAENDIYKRVRSKV
jgi:hypothetical protein